MESKKNPNIQLKSGNNQKCIIHVIGVLHIKAMSQAVIKHLQTITPSKKTAFFIEPSNELIQKRKSYKHTAVESFFNTIIHYANQKNHMIFPLNATEMPSHQCESLLDKCAAQTAEEEWMAKSIIETINTSDITTAIIIIGNVHAQRLAMLLNTYEHTTKITSLAPETPDEHILQSWRFGALGLQNMVIDLSWLSNINRIIANQLNKDPHNIQEQCWNDDELFEKYCILVKQLIDKYPAEKMKVTIPKEDQLNAYNAYLTARSSLRMQRAVEITQSIHI